MMFPFRRRRVPSFRHCLYSGLRQNWCAPADIEAADITILTVVHFHPGTGLCRCFGTHDVRGDTGAVQFPADLGREFVPGGDIFLRGERMTVRLGFGSIPGVSVLRQAIS